MTKRLSHVVIMHTDELLPRLWSSNTSATIPNMHTFDDDEEEEEDYNV